MRHFLTGGTGYIGGHLVRALLERGDECVVLSRGARDPWRHSRARVIRGDPTNPGPWQDEIAKADVVINLVGERIVDPPYRWTRARKARLKSSRVDATQNVVDAIHNARGRPSALISASAVGYYGSRGDNRVDESAPPGSDFLARLAVEWEDAARGAEDACQVTVLRSAPLLGAVLPPMLPIFKLGLGGPWGSGRLWWPWVHVVDAVAIIFMAIDRGVGGAINVTVPDPVTVQQFTTALGRALRRPALLRVPAWALHLGLGEAAEALLNVPRATPARAVAAGYRFRFPELEAALADTLE